MALQNGAFNRPQAPTTKRTYATIREMMYTLVYLGATEKQEPAYEDRNKPAAEQTLVDKIEFKFVVVLPGADEAQAALEALPLGEARDKALEAFRVKYLDKGHGRFFWLNCNKTISKGGEGKKESNAYKVIRGLVNDGEHLTDDQMKNLVGLLNELETVSPRPQYLGYITAENGKNKLTRIASRVAEDEMLPDWRQLARVADPREAGDDPSIVCEVTGERIHGYEISAGDRKGEWVSNVDAAKLSKERYGKVLCPSEIRKAKQQLAASGGKEALPF